ncbi:MAG: hypothetical protein DRP52_01290 [Planctomycetota bacterium]|nr:MAG: hypothetical protein DRP52_01290 [Planctomycetota bacterium]
MKYGVSTPFSFLLVLVVLAIQTVGFSLDTSKYIGIDEVHPDMEAYCLSVFSGTKVEKFGLKILSVVRGVGPGQDMILVLGTDERFRRSSAVHGCSGSSVFIDGRLAGALAAGWDGSLDALYLVRPIERMLEVGSADASISASDRTGFGFDFSRPLDIDAYYQQSIRHLQDPANDSRMHLPLSSSLPAGVIAPYDAALKGMGFLSVGAAGLLPSRSFEEVGTYERGGVLALVLCGGDISWAATGTVTEVIGDQVYGFGHQFRGQGAVDLPMATGVVHTVVASRQSSFKLSSPGPVSGVFQFDQSSGIRGTVGRMPRTIPLRIEVDRYNDPKAREYNCYLAADQAITPMILQMVLDGAANMQGPLPLEHTIRYSGQITLKGVAAVRIDNVSSGRQISEIGRELYSAVGLLLNNPFGKVNIDSINIKMSMAPVSTTASIWAVDVSQTTVRPGQTITASVALRSYRSQEETAAIDLKIPETLAAGTYKIQIMGGPEYQSFVSKMAPQRFIAVDLTSLETALDNRFKTRRDRLYAVMQTPASGVVIRRHELGQLPPTKMLLMQDSKRLQPLEPYKAWTENHIELDRIVDGSAEIEVTVKQ